MCIFEDHVNQMFDNSQGNGSSLGEQKNSEVVVPQFIKCAQRLIWKKFRIGVMQDAQEFLRFFLEALHKACLPKNLQNDQVFRRLNPITASTTYIGQLFCGFFKSRIVCSNCGYISNTYDPFMDIPLDIMGVSTLENALKTFTKTEYLSGENRYACPSCKTKSDASKQLLIEKLPPLLTIQLKRFSYFGYGGKKPNKSVAFSETINMEPFMSLNSNKKSDSSQHNSNAKNPSHLPLEYRLWAVVCHAGNTLFCGHYYTYAKSIDNKWYCLNDEQVRQTTLENVLSESNKAYLLFYYKTSVFNRNLNESSTYGNNSEEYYLAPEISFINFESRVSKNKTVGAVGLVCNSDGRGKEGLSEFLDKIELDMKQKNLSGGTELSVVGSCNDSNTEFHVDQVGGIRLVLDPSPQRRDSSLSIASSTLTCSSLDNPLTASLKIKEKSTLPMSSCGRSSKSPLKNKRMINKLRALLFGYWSTISKTRRNLQSIICFKKLLTLFCQEKHTRANMSPFSKLNKTSDNRIGDHDKVNDSLTDLIGSGLKLGSRGNIEKWDDLELTLEDEDMLKAAKKSLLPKTNVRNDYDKDYDKGKVKKPLRLTSSREKQPANQAEDVLRSSTANRELFDFAQKNKSLTRNPWPLKNINKKKIRKFKA